MVSTDANFELQVDGYETVLVLQACHGGPSHFVGTAGKCRFCGSDDPTGFRQKAHTIPEALGNKWLFSRDECDACNALFSRYDQALADVVAPILTLGATKGKGNRVRKTGRSHSRSKIRHSRDAQGKRSLRLGAALKDDEAIGRIDLETGDWVLEHPLPSTPFRPRHAYKALCKIGYALLPEDELGNFTKLREWLQDPDDGLDFTALPVSIRFGYIGNSPPIAAVTMLRRKNSEDMKPYMVMMVAIGSLSFTIDLMPDVLDHHIPPVINPTVDFQFKAVLQGAGNEAMIIRYEHPVFLNWSKACLQPQPFSVLETTINPVTQVSRFRLRLRDP